ncbi:MAG TPA: peptidyl-dipeptidase Dcp [Vicinamibacterales bacterium]|nr:peptidyl-dipeptidase Dcp [Vicinamibacterales bacterium]
MFTRRVFRRTAVALVTGATLMTLNGCSQPAPAPEPAAPAGNPLLTASTLPFQAPPWDRIKSSDYAPAFDEAIAQHDREIAAIAADASAPTFENVFVALEKSGQTLSRVQLNFNTVAGANTDDTLQALEEAVAPKLAAHQDSIFLNEALFGRIETIYKALDQLKLDPEARRLVEYEYQQFVMAGAKLSGPDKATLKALNAEEASLSAKFTNALRAASKDAALVVADKAELAGLSDAQIAAAADAAKERGLTGKWLLPIINTTQQPSLESLTNRATREKLFKASWNRAERGDANDTRAIISRLAELRATRAKLLGQPNFSAWRLQDQMAKVPAHVQTFLADLVPAATAKAKGEAADIQALIDQQKGGFKVEPWDWDFYADQVRKAKYDLDAEQVKPYFELNRVLTDGVFFAAHELYGLTFKERHDLPVYQPDVRVFEVFDADGSHRALFYGDYFKRDNKNGGAWDDVMVRQSKLLGQQPVIYNVGNFPKPAAGQPALISFDDVTTMFHEFGHALHDIFADQQYETLSGATSVPRDFVEFPSQFNEHWALEPRVFANYARHYQAGAAMPQPLVDKIKKAAKFNQGYALTELLAAASLDMAWHTLPAGTPRQEPDTFEAAALKKTHLDISQVPPRYRSSYFLHIWANGYASGYYAYLWAEMIDDDAYSWFEENGGMTRENGQKFRDMVLSRGNAQDLATVFRNFRGRDPKIDALLVQRGLKEK